MKSNCPVCENPSQDSQSRFCTACGWVFSSHFDRGESSIDCLEKERLMTNWAKQIWERNQKAELRLEQAKTTIADQKNQIDDRQDEINLLRKRLERLTLEKEQTLKNAIEQHRERVNQLENTINQLQQGLKTAEKTSRQLLEELQNQLNERQAKIEELQQQSKQLIREKEQAEKLNQQLEQQRLPELQSELNQLKDRLTTLETANEKLENRLQKQQISHSQQQQNLQTQLKTAHEQIEHLTRQQRTAKVALSQWLQLELLEQFVNEIESIVNRQEALENIQRLQQKRLNEEWQNFPVHRHILQLIVNSLEQNHQQFRENLEPELETFEVIEIADAILAIRAEFKFHRIIQRDSAGDYIHGF